VVTPAGVLFEHTSGWADIRRQAAVDTATTMMAYSMSKTITAAAVLQLVEAGLIGLDDPIDRYVDSLPYGRHVTVRRLLSHTSGIPNPLPLRWVHPAEGVERASGSSFASFVTERILRTLAIQPGELGYVVWDSAHHATGYLEKYSLMNLVKGVVIDRQLVGGYSGRWLAIRSHYVNGPAFGGLVGTASAFRKFLQDQLCDASRLFNDGTRQLFYTEQQTTRGAPVPMTLGWHIGGRGGERFFYKEGGGGGFHCMMRLYPGPRIGTVVMANATQFNVARLLDAADASFLAEHGR
jgi:CubicO group peptidase (beta-lactamase class C family)